MEGQAARMKIDLLLAIQLNRYDEAYALAQQILKARPDDELIKKFSGFLQEHRAESTYSSHLVKEMDDDEVEVTPAQIECRDSEGSDWESDCDSSFSISEESNSEDDEPDHIVEKLSSPHKTPQKPTHECRSMKASPARNPSTSSIPQLPKILQPTKSSIIKKPI
jgi:hypothetical protein